MSLSSGKSALEAALVAIYSQGGTLRSVPVIAQEKADAIYAFAKSGIPTVIHTSFGGAVVGAMTVTPVLGMGIGGLDAPVAGPGLEVSQAGLKADLVQIWTHGNAIKTYPVVAKETAAAIFKYYSQAKIQTIDSSHAPLPAPPPVGPVVGPMFGIGGTITSVPGTGFDAAKPALKAEFIRIWQQIDFKSPHTVEQFAIEMAAAIHAFCIEGKVATIGTITAPASVAPPPLPPIGSYFPGVGTGTGTVT